GTMNAHRPETTEERPKPLSSAPMDRPSRPGSALHAPVYQTDPTVKTRTTGTAKEARAITRPSRSAAPRTPVCRCRANAGLSYDTSVKIESAFSGAVTDPVALRKPGPPLSAE